ncbi:hypothetical protein HYFRA_00007349 [Hymenoscyphus fraxineus]|uniref:tRNA (guanine(26)-N(2))-dimethyltransferase n=1 Tax=Hymenoscyphus fraxineus TaxID=746836 RepID=A0A9N9KRL5_9HELO|nr:hypothetical protein HYFRA_00007349 [Hymenoscyphus fraxineus]
MALPDISATPAIDQHILHDGKEYTTIKEGLAYLLVPASASKVPQTSPQGENQPQSVFYNPIQQFNRDLSVLAIKAYGEQVLETRKKRNEKSRKKLSAKKKDAKRKRAEEGPDNASRKAAKLEGEGDGDVASSEALNGGTETPKADTENAMELDNGAKDAETQPAENTDVGEKDDAPKPNEQSADAPPAIEEQPTPSSLPKPPTFTILDALSATGLRALRYIHEIPFATSVTANDLLPDATKTIKRNVKHNKLDDKIEAITGNALAHMYNVSCGESKISGKSGPPRPKYDVIDLDPYGTAAPFLDAAVQSVREDGGLLCVTCTDAGVWASNGYPEKSFSLYGGIPIKGMHSHEGGLRLILHAISASAAKYGLAMEPLLSLSIDFYARVFVKIHKSPAEVKFLAGKTMVVYNCDSGCGAWTTQMIARNKLTKNKNGNGYYWKHVFGQAPVASENCEHCGSKTHLAGPMYAGPLHSPDFIQKILNDLPNISKETYQTHSRIEGMLSTALEETLPPPSTTEPLDSPTAPSKTGRYDPAAIDHFPFFFIPSTLAKVIHCITPHENAIRGALRHLGYRCTRSHTKPGTIKTDAPWGVIWEVMREWVRQKAPIKEGAVKEGMVGWRILGLGEKDENSERTASTENGNDNENGSPPANGETEKEKTNTKPKIVFDENLGKEKDAKKLVRYQLNPRENWGPMNRAGSKGVKKVVVEDEGAAES